MEYRRRELVSRLHLEGTITSTTVRDAMLSVPREMFIPPALRNEAYIDHPLSIGSGQTISAPHMVAIICEELKASPGMKVLEIGSGSGYHAAVVSHLVTPGGKVFTVERVSKLAEFARSNIIRAGIDKIEVILGDGSVGYEDEAPYDRIYYTCAAPDIPRVVLDQLGNGGVLLGVVGPRFGTQQLVRYTKEGEDINKDSLIFCVFVPLKGKLGY